MRWLVIGLLVILGILALVWGRGRGRGPRAREPFQTAAPLPYEALLKIQDRPDIKEQIDKVMYPAEDETLQVTFPRNISIFALSKRLDVTTSKYNDILARNDLKTNYNALFAEFTGLTDTNWKNAEAKTRTCGEIAGLLTDLGAEIQKLDGRAAGAPVNPGGSLSDISGAMILAGKMKDENMDYQRSLKAICDLGGVDGINVPEVCKKLASRDELLYPLLGPADAVNVDTYEKGFELSEKMKVLKSISGLLKCEETVTNAFAFDADNGFEYVDTEALRIKLEELSPYYISPATMKYISTFIISKELLNENINTTAEAVAKLKTAAGAAESLTTGYYVPAAPAAP